MGGFGSGRWGWHRPNGTVEAARHLDVRAFLGGKPPRVGTSGTLVWGPPDKPAASVGYAVAGDAAHPVLRLTYTWTPAGGHPVPVDLDVRLVRAVIPRGGHRWWGVCPLARGGSACGRRVNRVYLPPGARYFGCRACHRLTYRANRAHDKRVSRLVRDPDGLHRLAAHGRALSVTQLGLVLAALTELEKRYERAAARFRRDHGSSDD